MQHMLLETVSRLFEQRLDVTALRQLTKQRAFAVDLWNAVEELGLPLAAVPENAGGSGLSLDEALCVAPLVGEYAIPLPIAETIVANWMLGQAGLTVAPGPAVFAATSSHDLVLKRSPEGVRVSGTMRRLAWARAAQSVVAIASDGAMQCVVRLYPSRGHVHHGENLAAVPRDDVVFEDMVVGEDNIAPVPAGLEGDALLAIEAALCACFISGALRRVLALTIQYAQDRVQFGRPLARFQAIQQNVALLAEQVALGRAASAVALAGLGAGLGEAVDMLSVAAAKAVAGEAAGIGAAIAHQVHGAIGFTEEHSLHFFTKSLWSWRDEGGTEAFWNDRLGGMVALAGPHGFWPTLTAALPSTAAAEAVRADVRAFLAAHLPDMPARERALSWMAWDKDFSHKMGARGWIGMTWPKIYGGQERSNAERYVILEEMLAAGAPVNAHWVADRQSGPLLLKLGTEEQRQKILPAIIAGECAFCIGMSEPDAGSDLASVRTKAERIPEGFRINGTKVWTTIAHRSQYMILFCRTSGGPDDRQKGTSQLLIDLANTDGITIRPIVDATGHEHFNEVVFEDAIVPADALIGREGDGWAQVTGELSLERSGPERFLSSMPVIMELLRVAGPTPDKQARLAIGRLAARLMMIRFLSREIADIFESGGNPGVQAAIVKDLGAVFEQEVPEVARLLVSNGYAGDDREFGALLGAVTVAAPSFSLRGGTREILRGIIARDLGLR